MTEAQLAAALRRATKRYKDAHEKRDALIVQARAEGMSLRKIAAVTGLTHPRVVQIVREREKR